jgi:hypothetical protein
VACRDRSASDAPHSTQKKVSASFVVLQCGQIMNNLRSGSGHKNRHRVLFCNHAAKSIMTGNQEDGLIGKREAVAFDTAG